MRRDVFIGHSSKFEWSIDDAQSEHGPNLFDATGLGLTNGRDCALSPSTGSTVARPLGQPRRAAHRMLGRAEQEYGPGENLAKKPGHYDSDLLRSPHPAAVLTER